MLQRLRVMRSLGIVNCGRVAMHRLLLGSGWYRLRAPVGDAVTIGHCFEALSPPGAAPAVADADRYVDRARVLLEGRYLFFGHLDAEVGAPPRWLESVFDPDASKPPKRHWSTIGEFDYGDIKAVWELSRFRWAIDLAQAYRLTGSSEFVEALAEWLDDWARANPINAGPNWRCGQETSIRLLNLLLAAEICLMNESGKRGLVAWVDGHAQRIEQTLSYALGQDNNHGTSEAAALLVAGEWLLRRGVSGPHARAAKRYARTGRRWLAERVERLIGEDGSFSQYSVNYHRVALDTLALAAWWCRELNVAGIAASCTPRLDAAITWLTSFVDPTSGDAPNLGANDGAYLLALGPTPFRDHRPSLQFAAALFRGERLFPAGPWDEACVWLGVDLAGPPSARGAGRPSRIFADGGFALLSSVPHSTWSVLRLPRFRFRPSHADALHLDIWVGSLNLTRDAGSYSYNCEEPWLSYFSSTRAHCTCELDGRDQMPRLSRFLFADWLSSEAIGDPIRESDGVVSCSAEYRDSRGAAHRRTVRLDDGVWQVRDEVSGYAHKAVLRWRLAPGDWELNGNELSGSNARISVVADRPVRRIELVDGWESRHYLQRTVLPVLEVEIGTGPATFETRIEPRLAA